MSSKIKSDITKRQNETMILKVQYAARHCFNAAEILNYFVWICCTLSFIASVISIESIKSYQVFFSFVFDLVAALLCYLSNRFVKMGSTYRAYFDSYVLGIKLDCFNDDDIHIMKENAELLFTRHKSKAEQQINNTGYDTPPGVKDWYEMRDSILDSNAVYECLKSNCWWTIRLLKKRNLIKVIAAIILLASLLATFCLTKTTLLLVIAGSAGFCLKIIERVYVNILYFISIKKIDGMKLALDTSRTKKQLDLFAEKVITLREIPVLGVNLLHKRFAKMLSTLYKNT